MNELQQTDVLISKFLAGEASPEEAMLLEDWKAENAENKRYFNECVAIVGIASANSSTDEAWKKLQELLSDQKSVKIQAPIRRLQVFYRVAAAVVLLCGLGTLLLYFLQDEAQQQIFTAHNSKKNIELTDGTQVVIAQHSSITLARDYGTGSRSVDLKGSGYFTVDHNEQLPFIVNTGPIHIKDLGTKFDVHTTRDTIFIRVDEGEVMIYDNKGTKITLKAHQGAYYVISTQTLEMAVEMSGKPDAVKVFVFDNRRLADVVGTLETAYKTKIRIQVPESGNCLITTQFSDEDLEIALSVIAETLGLGVEKDKDGYILTGRSCVQ